MATKALPFPKCQPNKFFHVIIFKKDVVGAKDFSMEFGLRKQVWSKNRAHHIDHRISNTSISVRSIRTAQALLESQRATISAKVNSELMKKTSKRNFWWMALLWRVSMSTTIIPSNNLANSMKKRKSHGLITILVFSSRIKDLMHPRTSLNLRRLTRSSMHRAKVCSYQAMGRPSNWHSLSRSPSWSTPLKTSATLSLSLDTKETKRRTHQFGSAEIHMATTGAWEVTSMSGEEWMTSPSKVMYKDTLLRW